MEDKQKNKYLFEAVIVSCLLLVLNYLYLVQPVMVRLNEVKQHSVLRQKKLESLKDIRVRLADLRERYRQLNPRFLSAEDILNILDRLSREQGLKIVEYTPQQTEEKVKVNLLVRGSFADTVKFLYSLKKQRREEYQLLTLTAIDNDLLARLIIDFNRKYINGKVTEDNQQDQEQLLFGYHDWSRDPFHPEKPVINNVDTKPRIVPEQIKLPFVLTGIIGSGDRRLALVNYQEQSILLKNGDRLAEDYRVLKINKEDLVLLYKRVTIRLGVGGSGNED